MYIFNNTSCIVYTYLPLEANSANDLMTFNGRMVLLHWINTKTLRTDRPSFSFP